MHDLFEETRIRTLTLANRFVRSATWMGMAAPDGTCTDRLLATYETLAGGGLGLIVTGFACVSREGQGPPGQLGIWSDAHVDGLRELVARVHAAGGKIAVQLVHNGDQARREHNDDNEVIGPSEWRDEEGTLLARPMTHEEIARVVADFGAAAARARAAGFDAIQLHAAHGYLASQFLCPNHNRRDDEYGGSLDNRARFLREVYGVVREAAGPDHPVLAKLNVEDFVPGGLTREDGVRVAVQLRDLGLDALEVSGGLRESGDLGPARRRIREPADEGYFEANAVAVKEATGLPVILVGGLRRPETIARIRRETGLDYFAFSRPLIREPHLIRRWQGGDAEPAACISCSGCFLSVKKGRGVFCVKTELGGE